MPHVRQIIREAVASACSGLPTTANNVFANRTNPYITLPSLSVYTDQEDVRHDLGAMDTTQIRELRLVVEGRAKATSTPDDTLDVMADEVIEAVLNDADVKSLAWNITIEDIEFSHSRDGSHPVGKAEIIFAFLYQTDGADPSNILS